LNQIARVFLILAFSVLPAAGVSLPAFGKTGDVQVQRLWQYAHAPSGIGQKSEIVAYDDRTDTLWVAGVVGVDVLDRATGAFVDHDGLAALAIENTVDRTRPGVVVFYDTLTREQDGVALTVGALPDMLIFTPNGKQVLVANEAMLNPWPTPLGLSSADPVGSVSIPGDSALRLLPATGTLPTQPATYTSM
jgi:hypothetical protein